MAFNQQKLVIIVFPVYFDLDILFILIFSTKFYLQSILKRKMQHKTLRNNKIFQRAEHKTLF